MTAKKSVKHVTHLLTDWRHIACRKSTQTTGDLYASRDPGEVTCLKCRKFAPHAFHGGGANMVGPSMAYYATMKHGVGGGGARASATIEELGEVGPYARLRRDRKTGIAWVEDGRTGTGHTCHPNIASSGSVTGMKRLGHWKKTDRTVRSHGFIYNIDHCSTSMPYDKVARDACRCGGVHH